MLKIYRIEKGAEPWKYKAYDYIRTDAFCIGQNIPIELEFSHDEKEEELQAVMEPARYTGRAASQVEEFISGIVQPILDANKDVLGVKAEINV